MILPLGDSPNPRGIPFVTYGLLLVNVAVYLLITLPLGAAVPESSDPRLWEYVRLLGESVPRHALQRVLQQVSEYDLFLLDYGFRPAHPSVVALFSSIFLHGGFTHLFGNMLFLWIYGDNVEHRLGATRYVAAYLATGVAATLFHALFSPGSQLPMIGASGAISGVLGFYFLWFPHNRVRLLAVFFPFLMNVIAVPARLVLGFYLVLDNLLPFLVTRGVQGGGVAYGAHIGGFLAGLAIAYYMNRREATRRPREYRQRRARRGARPAGDARALARTIAAGRLEEAARMYFALPAAATRRLLGARESLELGQWLQRQGHAQAALAVYRRHLRDYPQGPGAAEAHVGAGLVQLHDLQQATPAFQHFLDALECDPSADTAAAARAGLRKVEAMQKLRVGAERRLH
jgi:membrane associated rhomboid family serine protease